jgi:hypothetical protein
LAGKTKPTSGHVAVDRSGFVTDFEFSTATPALVFVVGDGNYIGPTYAG